MDYVRLDSTNIEVSRLGLGAMAFGSRRWREWINHRAEVVTALDEAEVARPLGLDLAEAAYGVHLISSCWGTFALRSRASRPASAASPI